MRVGQVFRHVSELLILPISGSSAKKSPIKLDGILLVDLSRMPGFAVSLTVHVGKMLSARFR